MFRKYSESANLFDNIIDNESAFVTSLLTKSEIEEKLAKLSDVVANIRVMD